MGLVISELVCQLLWLYPQVNLSSTILLMISVNGSCCASLKVTVLSCVCLSLCYIHSGGIVTLQKDPNFWTIKDVIGSLRVYIRRCLL